MVMPWVYYELNYP